MGYLSVSVNNMSATYNPPLACAFIRRECSFCVADFQVNKASRFLSTAFKVNFCTNEK